MNAMQQSPSRGFRRSTSRMGRSGGPPAYIDLPSNVLYAGRRPSAPDAAPEPSNRPRRQGSDAAYAADLNGSK